MKYGRTEGKKIILEAAVAGNVDQDELWAIFHRVDSDDEEDIDNLMVDSDTEFETITDMAASLVNDMDIQIRSQYCTKYHSDAEPNDTQEQLQEFLDFKEISLLNRDELLTKKTKPKDQQKTIFVTTWHPKLKQLPSILRQNFHNLENDPRLKEIFPEKPMVAFKRKKTIGNHIVRSDINKKPSSINNTTPCKNCKKNMSFD